MNAKRAKKIRRIVCLTSGPKPKEPTYETINQPKIVPLKDDKTTVTFKPVRRHAEGSWMAQYRAGKREWSNIT